MPAGKGEETGCCPLERGPRRKLIKVAPVDYTLALPWALAISLSRTESGAATAANLQHPPKGVQGGEQKRGTLSYGRTSL